MVGFGSIEQVVDEGYTDVVSEVIFAIVMGNLSNDKRPTGLYQSSFKGMVLYHYPLLLLSFYPIEHIPEMIVYDNGRKSLWRGRCPNERRWYTTGWF